MATGLDYRRVDKPNNLGYRDTFTSWYKGQVEAEKRKTTRGGWVKMKAKYAGQCDCGNRLRKGKQIFFNPRTGTVRCTPCGPREKVKG